MWFIFFNDIFLVFGIVHDINLTLSFCVNTASFKNLNKMFSNKDNQDIFLQCELSVCNIYTLNAGVSSLPTPPRSLHPG